MFSPQLSQCSPFINSNKPGALIPGTLKTKTMIINEPPLQHEDDPSKKKKAKKEKLTKKSLRKKLLNSAEAMEILQVGRTCLYNYRKDGLLKYSQPKGKLYFYLDDLLDFIKKNPRGLGRKL